MMLHFHKIAQVQYLDEMDIFCTCVKKILSVCNSAKVIKIEIF